MCLLFYKLKGRITPTLNRYINIDFVYIKIYLYDMSLLTNVNYLYLFFLNEFPPINALSTTLTMALLNFLSEISSFLNDV